ncbi:hypothetical protein niasHT_027180 [Heterodera trifolii]|uniref:Uncharacterized protein n=1 Tax=Heterodera trifolii TaxID=157864 RepID=A0ABD2KPG3_9BILA
MLLIVYFNPANANILGNSTVSGFLSRVLRQQDVSSRQMFDWKSGKEIKLATEDRTPIMFNSDGEIEIDGLLINGALPELIKLYFNGGPEDNERQLTLRMCAAPCLCDGLPCECKLTVCYVGLMDPATEAIQSQFFLENFEKNNEIANDCKKAQKKWKAFNGQVLHGFRLEYDADHHTLKVSTSINSTSESFDLPKTDRPSKCINIMLGENGYLDGYVEGNRKAHEDTFKEKAWYGYLLCMESGITALSYDFLAGIPQGGEIGIIGKAGSLGLYLVKISYIMMG